MAEGYDKSKETVAAASPRSPELLIRNRSAAQRGEIWRPGRSGEVLENLVLRRSRRGDEHRREDQRMHGVLAVSEGFVGSDHDARAPILMIRRHPAGCRSIVSGPSGRPSCEEDRADRPYSEQRGSVSAETKFDRPRAMKFVR